MFFGGTGPDAFGEQHHWHEPPTQTNTGRHDLRHYTTLQLAPDCSQKDIKKAYRQLARTLHPDKGGDPESFKRLQEAYDVLKDPEQRARYDACGDSNIPFAQTHASAMDAFATSIFGGLDRPNVPKKGRSVTHLLKVSLEDLYKGKRIRLSVTRLVIEGRPLACAACNGRGKVATVIQLGPGMATHIQQSCAQCGGAGVSYQTKKAKHVLAVYIESGMRHGDQITFPRASDEIVGGEAGDVIFKLVEKEHPVFGRRNGDLLYTHTLCLHDALCGYAFKLVHLDGRTLAIASNPGEIVHPPNSKSKLIVRKLENEGMPLPNTGGTRFGDLYIAFDVEFPELLSTRNMADLGRALPKHTRAHRPAGSAGLSGVGGASEDDVAGGTPGSSSGCDEGGVYMLNAVEFGEYGKSGSANPDAPGTRDAYTSDDSSPADAAPGCHQQ